MEIGFEAGGGAGDGGDILLAARRPGPTGELPHLAMYFFFFFFFFTLVTGPRRSLSLKLIQESMSLTYEPASVIGNVQGYLAQSKQRPPRTLQYGYV
jgi:hypothetical protein